MFQAIVALQPVGDVCKTFPEAFKNFHTGVSDMIAGGTSRQVLETACFIRYVFTAEEREFQTQMDFYDCCDLASDIGLLSDDGKLQEGATREVPIQDIQNIFLRKTTEEIVGMLDMADAAREGVLASEQ